MEKTKDRNWLKSIGLIVLGMILVLSFKWMSPHHKNAQKHKAESVVAVESLPKELEKNNNQARTFTYKPANGYASTTKADYVEPSVKTKLKPGQQIKDLTDRNYNGLATVQRLTDNTYWMQSGFYNTIVYVGDESVLVLDPLGYGNGASILAEIKKITDKPVTTVVYSHQHEDHIGDISFFVEDAKKNNTTLEIISSDKTKLAMENNGSTLPLATKTISFDGGTTKFESLTLKVVGFDPAAHVKDSALWLLVEEGIVHAPDMVNPNQMPYLNFGGSETFNGYEENLKTIKNEKWKFFSGGHGNIGSMKDIDFMMTYVKNLKSAVQDGMKKYADKNFFSAEFNNHQASAHASTQYIVDDAVKTLRSQYGEYYGFEVSVPYQAKMVVQHYLGE